MVGLLGCSSKVVIVHTPDGSDRHGCCTDDEATTAEIEAVKMLSFSKDRAEMLNQIARRPRLGPTAQVCLVDTVLDELSFENEKVEVLLALIQNPSFLPAGKSRVLKRLDALGFNKNRKLILEAINRRGPVFDVDEGREEEIVIELPVADDTPAVSDEPPADVSP